MLSQPRGLSRSKRPANACAAAYHDHSCAQVWASATSGYSMHALLAMLHLLSMTLTLSKPAFVRIFRPFVLACVMLACSSCGKAGDVAFQAVGSEVTVATSSPGTPKASLVRVSQGATGARAWVAFQNVGSRNSTDSAFYENVANFRADERRPLFEANPGAHRNIYSPNTAWNGGTVWNVYFHGYDGLPEPPPVGGLHDRIYRTVSNDNFATFSQHLLTIDHGEFENVGNEAVVKLGDTDWTMYYTALPVRSGGAVLNKPAFSYGSNGASFAPNQGSSGTLLAVDRWPGRGWAEADINGGNGVLVEPSLRRHMYWNDSRASAGIHHVTSTDGRNWQYVEQVSVGSPPAITDIRSLGASAEPLYALAIHENGPALKWLRTRSPKIGPMARFADLPTLFPNLDDDDYFMLTPGLVTRGGSGKSVSNRLYGVVYGASPKNCPTLTRNRVFARWLQKHVRFTDAAGTIDIARARGPETGLLALQTTRTGKVVVYGEDWNGTSGTIVASFENVTIAPGDTFKVDFLNPP
jgi:hypothetical protein